MAEKEENSSITARSNSKVVTKAATKLLSSLKEKGKDGQVMPVVMNRFFSALGGPEAYADLMATDFQKARGIGLTPTEEETYIPSMSLIKDWYDLVARVQKQADSDKQLDVGSLEESDLESILTNVALKAVKEDTSLQMAVITQAIANEVLRKQIFEACIRADSSLVNDILQAGGKLFDAPVLTKSEPENITVEEDTEEYNPHADEYRESDA